MVAAWPLLSCHLSPHCLVCEDWSASDAVCRGQEGARGGGGEKAGAGAWLRPRGCWGCCPRGEGPLWPPTRAVGHPFSGGLARTPRGRSGASSQAVGATAQVPALTHARSSPQVFPKVPGLPLQLGGPCPTYCPPGGSPTCRGPSLEAQGRGPLPHLVQQQAPLTWSLRALQGGRVAHRPLYLTP